MKLDIGGEERFVVPVDRLWQALNDPEVLTRCIPGCKQMIAAGEDKYRVVLDLKVASVGGSFEGAVSLSDKTPPNECRITVSGAGTLGQGNGHATFSLMTGPDGVTTMRYAGEGEMGGLVVGVGQRVLKGVAKHLIGRFFTTLRKEAGEAAAPPV
jgi:uncharacterized protein